MKDDLSDQCRVSGCFNPVVEVQRCMNHYMQWRRRGYPDPPLTEVHKRYLEIIEELRQEHGDRSFKQLQRNGLLELMQIESFPAWDWGEDTLRKMRSEE